MIPVTVERWWRGERGAVSWWVDAQFVEANGESGVYR